MPSSWPCKQLCVLGGGGDIGILVDDSLQILYRCLVAAGICLSQAAGTQTLVRSSGSTDGTHHEPALEQHTIAARHRQLVFSRAIRRFTAVWRREGWQRVRVHPQQLILVITVLAMQRCCGLHPIDETEMRLQSTYVQCYCNAQVCMCT